MYAVLERNWPSMLGACCGYSSRTARHVALLKGLLKQRCPWDERATWAALDAPDRRCLQLLLRHACAPDCRRLRLGDQYYCGKCLATGKYSNNFDFRDEVVLEVQSLKRCIAENKWAFREDMAGLRLEIHQLQHLH